HGIDAAAHRGALEAAGRTVAVLGSGIDVRYPASSRDLLARIAGSGTIVSEYPPAMPAGPQHFPARNRIVVALARALVVVEGAAKSGSRISVDHALDLGREVFAVPGPVTSPLAETPLEMIREGATLIRGPDDLLDDLGIDRTAPPPAPPDLDDGERRVWDALSGGSLPDAVAREAGMSIPDAVSTLIQLELRGLIVSIGGRYERRHRPWTPAVR
ncbi:MAG: DNA-protecting protein DprA, partial [Actinomycetota bacterium]|nr:DNA-protecting protein DprA [Actinomycetota bacterium]